MRVGQHERRRSRRDDVPKRPDRPDSLDAIQRLGNAGAERLVGSVVSEARADQAARQVSGTTPAAPQQDGTGRDRGGAADTSAFKDAVGRRGGGQALSPQFAGELGSTLGADVSALRVHDSPRADVLCRSIDAQAFTYGRDMYFQRGAFAPSTTNGRALVAHEAAHAVGQTTTAAAPTVQRAPGALTGVDWAKATEAKPSLEGGMGGIMRIKVGSDWQIIKPEYDPGGTKIAEDLMTQIGGATTTNSVMIPKGSEEWTAIMVVLRTAKQYEADDKYRGAWDRNMHHFTDAPYLALQTNMVALGGVEMEQLVHSDSSYDIMRVLEPSLLHELGRALAADTLLGNADRFEAMNSGNAFVLPHDKIGAIDSATAWSRYDAWVSAFTTQNTFAPGDPIGEWVTALTSGGDLVRDGRFEKAPTSDIGRVFGSFEHWFDMSFWVPLYQKLKPEKREERPVTLDEVDKPIRDAAYHSVRLGLEEGMRRVDAYLRDQHAMANLKQQMQQNEQQYGRSDSVDWRAFKTRRAYILSLTSGGDAETARRNATEVATYMFDWKQKVATSAAAWDASYDRVVAPPGQLSKREKFKRKFTRKSHSDKQAATLKKQARNGTVDDELLDDVERSGTDDRRKDKALSEVYSRKFLGYLTARRIAFEQLNDEKATERKRLGTPAPSGEIAAKKIAHVDKVKQDPATKATIKRFHDVTEEWMHALGPSTILTDLLDERHFLEEAVDA